MKQKVCPECNKTVNLSRTTNAWQIHVMQHRLNDPVFCGLCDWAGTKRGFIGHARGRHDNVKVTRSEPVDVLVPEPEIPAQPDPVEVLPEDSLERIVEDLLGLASRIEQYAMRKQRDDADLKILLRRFLEA